MTRSMLKLAFSVVPLFALVVVVTATQGGSGDAQEASRDPALFGKPGYVFDDPDVELTLTAQVAQSEIYPGEIVETWTYNGQYPGPAIRAEVGDKVRVTLVNELPEATSIHWHGLDVPNDQDGAAGHTQPPVQPGETWTYEWVANRPGTMAYHSHQNTIHQLGRGLFGSLIIVDPSEPVETTQDLVMQLHEIDGLYTINGRSFPATEQEDAISVTEGETIRIRFVNMGSMYHPMHVHGHQMRVVAVDGHAAAFEEYRNTVDVPPGQTVDVVIEADNPGTWMFHCHVLPHVTNKGQYPGGMLTVIDYSDHTSYGELHGGHEPVATQTPAPEPATPEDGATPQATATNGTEASTIEIVATQSVFDQREIHAAAGETVTVRLINRDGAVPHNISIYESASAKEAIYLGDIVRGNETAEFSFSAPAAGTYFFRCDLHPTTMTGELSIH